MNNNEPQAIVEEFADTFGLTFPILLEAGVAYGQYSQSPAVSPYPLDYVIDQGGQVAYFNSEYDPELMVAVIDQLLGQYGPDDHRPPKPGLRFGGCRDH